MSRLERIALFKAEAARGTITTFLIEPSDPRLQGERLLRDAISFFVSNIERRRPICFGCRAKFTADVTPAAFLLAVASASPNSASTSALCMSCWRNLSDDEIEKAATRVLKPIVPGGLAARP